MADKRIWAKVDLGYLTNPKMSDVLDASSTATLMHLASILHCAQHLTDGHASPKAMQRAVGGTAEDTDLLIQAGLWHGPDHECGECPQPEEGRIYVHNYLEHNRSADDAKALSETRSEVARKGWEKRKGKASSKQVASTDHANSKQGAVLYAVQNEDVSNAEREEREEKKRGEKEEAPRKRNPHSLPTDFAITDDMRTWAHEVTPAVDIDRETFDFIHYWTQGEGTGKKKSDWVRTWQNNMKRKQQWAEDRGWKPKPPPEKDLTNPMNW